MASEVVIPESSGRLVCSSQLFKGSRAFASQLLRAGQSLRAGTSESKVMEDRLSKATLVADLLRPLAGRSSGWSHMVRSSPSSDISDLLESSSECCSDIFLLFCESHMSRF